jgi:glycosidase
MMNGVKTVTDGYVRKDFPGGWTGDQNNAFTAKGRTDKQNECYNFYRNLLNWRKGSEVISKGTMKQFIVENGVYAYARQYNGKTIFVMLNGTDKEENIPMSCYKEVLNDATQGRDILSKEIIRWGETLKMTPRQSLVLEIN